MENVDRKVLGSNWSALKSVAGKTFQAFPAHAQPTIYRIWQEAHVANAVTNLNARSDHDKWKLGHPSPVAGNMLQLSHLRAFGYKSRRMKGMQTMSSLHHQ